MKNQEERKPKTLDELVAIAVAQASYVHPSRFELGSRVTSVWVDEAAGFAWRKLHEELQDAEWSLRGRYTSEGYVGVPGKEEEFKAAETALRQHESCRPEEKKITEYWLETSNGRYHSTAIYLTPELGEMVTNIWTTKTNRYGSKERVGLLTLKGILNRLGMTDIGDKIEAARKKEEEMRLKANRNWHRVQIREAMDQLNRLIDRAREAGVVVEHPSFSPADDLTEEK